MTAAALVDATTGTLEGPVGPEVYASVDVTVTGAASGDIFVATPTNVVIDSTGVYGVMVSAVDTNTVTVKCNKPQLPSDLTFNLVGVTPAS